MRTARHLWVLVLGIAFAGCGTFTGIPSHGGGKRFAVEQELIAASARAAARSLEVGALAGRKCALFITTIGDQGAGNLFGGRFELQAAIIDTAKTKHGFPSPRGSINYPESTQTKGLDFRGTTGQPNTYRSEPFVNPNDTRFLNAVLNEALTLRGLLLVSPKEADVYVYVTVDVFGTNRSRLDYFLVNQERLKAKTSLHVMAIDRRRSMALPPTTSSWEAEYFEDYLCWIGPVRARKVLRKGGHLLVDFTSMEPLAKSGKTVEIENPFLPSGEKGAVKAE